MRRRDLLKSLGAAALALRAGADVLARGTPGTRKNFVWLRPDVKKPADTWKREFALMKASGIDAINPEIYNGSSALYGSHRLPVKAAWLEMALPLASDAGLEVHAWMWTMP